MSEDLREFWVGGFRHFNLRIEFWGFSLEDSDHMGVVCWPWDFDNKFQLRNGLCHKNSRGGGK